MSKSEQLRDPPNPTEQTQTFEKIHTPYDFLYFLIITAFVRWETYSFCYMSRSEQQLPPLLLLFSFFYPLSLSILFLSLFLFLFLFICHCLFLLLFLSPSLDGIGGFGPASHLKTNMTKRRIKLLEFGLPGSWSRQALLARSPSLLICMTTLNCSAPCCAASAREVRHSRWKFW